jgi:predicted CXXCH cytochrome family protein
MKYLEKWTDNVLVALQVFLLFLVAASDYVVLPSFLMWGGRLHPLLLHLPIGVFLFTCLLWWLRGHLESDKSPIFQWALAFSALSVPLTAISGFFLSREGGYEEELLRNHLWGGVVLSVLTWALWTGIKARPQRTNWWNGLFAVAFLALLATGHWGGQLTHGTAFLAWPGEKSEEESQVVGTTLQASMSTSFYEAYVQPVWQGKCVSCHRPGKAKGQLVLQDVASALKGGETGPIWTPGNVEKSLFLQRIHLPLTDKEHMPPRGKTQLEPQEVALLEAWVRAGADTKLALGEIGDGHPLQSYVSSVGSELPEKRYTFPPASAGEVEKLNDAYCVVRPIAAASPALQADFFIRKAFDASRLNALQAVEEQLVRLNLGNMPVGDADMKALLSFSNLEKLILNHTDISDGGLEVLKKLPKLESLSLNGTKISTKAGAVLATFPALREVFLWNTQWTPEQVAQLQKKYPKIRWNHGFTPSPKDILALSPPVFEDAKPIMAAGDSLRLKMAIPGVEIRYTLDGSEPDSTTSSVYRRPLVLKGITTIKARAFKAGWIGSETAEMTIYKKGKKPDKVVLLTQPNPEYAPKPDVLANAELGNITQFRSGQWAGYKDRHMEALFYFNPKTPPAIRSVALSYGVNVGSYIVPPVQVEVWGGTNPDNMTLLEKKDLAAITIADLADQESRGLLLPFEGAQRYPVYKMVVRNLPKLPVFHPGKGTPGWAFVDEVFFNE